MNNYNLIVIGGGISGLTTAIAWLLNRDGPVLVMEKEVTPGGCVATFSRAGYRFDTVQILPDMTDLLEYLGITLKLRKYEGTLSRLFLADANGSGGTLRRYSIPADAARFEEELIRAWPDERRRITRFFRTCREMVAELAYLTLEPTPTDFLKIMVKCPHIVRASGDTWKRFLRGFGFRSRDLIETLDLFSSYAGLSGDRCAALLTVSAMTTSLAGSWRPETAFVKLPDAMRARVRELGGEVRTGYRAGRILFDDQGRVKGVRIAGGAEILADTVVSTVDTGAFLRDLIGEDRLRATRGPYRTILKRLQMSHSMIAIHLGLDGELDLKAFGLTGAYNVLTTGRAAQERAFRAPEMVAPPLLDPPNASAASENETKEPFHIAFYSPSLANGSAKQTLVIHVSPVRAEPWITLRARDPEAYQAAKMNCARKFVGILERELIGGLSDHIVFTDVATPATISRYLGAPDGSCFDMLPVLSQFGLARLPLRTPFPGLYHTKFSHGIWPAMHSGLQVMDLITGGAVMNRGARYQRDRARDEARKT